MVQRMISPPQDPRAARRSGFQREQLAVGVRRVAWRALPRGESGRPRRGTLQSETNEGWACERSNVRALTDHGLPRQCGSAHCCRPRRYQAWTPQPSTGAPRECRSYGAQTPRRAQDESGCPNRVRAECRVARIAECPTVHGSNPPAEVDRPQEASLTISFLIGIASPAAEQAPTRVTGAP